MPHSLEGAEMPLYFAFDSTHKILCCEFSGALNDKALMDFYATATVHARNIMPKAGLLEFKDITSVNLSTAAISALAGAAPIMPEVARPRIIVAPTDLIYGKFRAFELLGGNTRPNLHIVRSIAEAYSVLEISNPQFKPFPEASISHQDIDHRTVAATNKSR